MIPEFSRIYDIRHLPGGDLRIAANAGERTALAERFGVAAIARLEAEATLVRDSDAVLAQGRFEADLTQSCAVSGEPLATRIAEPFAVRFVPAAAPHGPDAEVELSAAELDEIVYQDGKGDLGEAVAQSLSLAIDPYATGPEADVVRREVGLGEQGASGPFAALASLKK